MKPKSIGIVGGAGPLAGIFFFECLANLSRTIYGCHKDADFPKIFLLSFPFSEMLSPAVNSLQIKKELKECLNQLRQNGASILAIACNTLHGFLDENDNFPDLVHLPQTVAQQIPSSETPLVLCTSTAARLGLHKKFFPCIYPNITIQHRIDQIIDQILKGDQQQKIIDDLSEIIEKSKEKRVILGCTELSIFRNKIIFNKKLVIDPLLIACQKILKISFSQNPGNP
jgi:aspartate racemase